MADEKFSVAIPLEGWITVRAQDSAHAEAIGQMVQNELYDLLDGRDLLAMLRAAADEDFPAPIERPGVISSGVEAAPHGRPLTITKIAG